MYSFLTQKSFRLLLLALLPLNLLAHVQLDYPQGGETFNGGDSVTIQWTEVIHHNTLNWELYFSSDGGVTWQVIDDDIDYAMLSYKWGVPNLGTSLGRIKVVQNNEETNYESESGDFTIVPASGIKTNSAVENLLNSFKIEPNPMRSNCNFVLQSEKPDQVSIFIYALDGKKVDEIPKVILHIGQNQIAWNKNGLKAGNYIGVLKADGLSKSIKFQVLHE